jgi:hypothetical protein
VCFKVREQHDSGADVTSHIVNRGDSSEQVILSICLSTYILRHLFPSYHARQSTSSIPLHTSHPFIYEHLETPTLYAIPRYNEY